MSCCCRIKSGSGCGASIAVSGAMGLVFSAMIVTYLGCYRNIVLCVFFDRCRTNSALTFGSFRDVRYAF